MNTMTKSLIRHSLTILGSLLVALGLGQYSDLLKIIADNFEPIVNAVLIVSGVVTSVIGFFTDRKRFKKSSI